MVRFYNACIYIIRNLVFLPLTHLSILSGLIYNTANVNKQKVVRTLNYSKSMNGAQHYIIIRRQAEGTLGVQD